MRLVEKPGRTSCLLTFKGTMLDDVSTPEHETEVGSSAAVDAILSRLGLERIISYTKRCENFTFDTAGHRIVATLVEVPELDGTFIEVETLVPDGMPVDGANDVIRRVIADLGLTEDDLEPTFYIDMVSARRAST